jgi:hypothetical protein
LKVVSAGVFSRPLSSKLIFAWTASMTHLIILPSLSTVTATAVESTCAKPSFSPASADFDREVMTANPVFAEPGDVFGEAGAEAPGEGEGDLGGVADPDGEAGSDGAGVGLALHPTRSAVVTSAQITNIPILFI